MNQSQLIGGALLAGFALFLAKQNRLSVYGRVLWGDKPDSHKGDGQTEKSPTESGVGVTGNKYADQYLFGGGGVLKDFWESVK